ncbi:efflux RND transporter periplasmic adaptor subunit [bacterium]|nr:efflux RND transporter periplasmic adaptor subunit [bacterium]
MKGLIYLILFAAVLAGGWYAYKYWQESQTDTSVEVVKTAPAIKRDISDILEETGTINPVNKVAIKSEVSGRVQNVYVEDGMMVTAGFVLVELDKTDLLNTRKDLDYELKEAELNYSRAKIDHDRNYELFQKRIISYDAYDQVKTTLDLRSNTILKVITKLDTNTDNLKKTTIFSPSAGTVLNKNIEVGEMVVGANSVSSGTEMMTVADLKDLEVSSYVNEIDVTRLHVGQEIDITVDSTPGVDYSGVVTHVAPMSSSSSGSSAGSSSSSSSKDGFEVRIAVKGDVSQLKMGMTANITATLKEVKDALCVPLSAVFCDNYEVAPSAQKYYVFVEKKQNVAEGQKAPQQEFEKRDVIIGVTDTMGAEVKEGLSEGEMVALKRPPSMSEPTRNHDWMRRGR